MRAPDAQSPSEQARPESARTIRAAYRLASTELRGVWAALSFLTRLPLDRDGRLGPDDVAAGAWAFPLVGAAIGATAAAVGILAHLVLRPLVASVISVMSGILLTGALHLDGLADTADGYGAKNPARALEVMRDPHLGAFGVAAVVVDLALRIGATTSLLTSGGAHAVEVLVAADALSRAGAVMIGAFMPAARAEPGITGQLSRGTGRAILACSFAVVLATLLLGGRAIAAIGVTGAILTSWGWRCRRRLGGVTGDALGAAVEAIEVAVLLVGVAR
jgi:adenosylcobinamide-GDP ribazoletransferase